MSLPQRDIENREDIVWLVSTFYSQAIEDEVIGHFFTQVAMINLAEHLPIMYDFWENLLFQTGGYQGGMMYKHLLLNQEEPMRKEHFVRWLQLFHGTVDRAFAGPVADEAKERADNIARGMLLRMDRSQLPFAGQG